MSGGIQFDSTAITLAKRFLSYDGIEVLLPNRELKKARYLYAKIGLDMGVFIVGQKKKGLLFLREVECLTWGVETEGILYD